MKSQTLPIKRRPVSQGVFRRLSAVTQSRRKQRVSASATAGGMELEDGGSRISWALTIVLLIHVVALCLIFIHHHFLSGRPVETAAAVTTAIEGAVAVVDEPVAEHVVDSRISADSNRYIVKSGETYASIAKAKDVTEVDLRELNGNVALRGGRVLKILVKRVVVRPPANTQVAVAAAAVVGEEEPVVPVVPVPTRPARDEGLVPAIDVRDAPRAVTVAQTSATGAHVVQPGESVWGIAKRYGVPQDKLMEANGIKDARKLFVGMKLEIPK